MAFETPGSPSDKGKEGQVVPTLSTEVGGSDGTNLHAISVDALGRINVNGFGYPVNSSNYLCLNVTATTDYPTQDWYLNYTLLKKDGTYVFSSTKYTLLSFGSNGQKGVSNGPLVLPAPIQMQEGRLIAITVTPDVNGGTPVSMGMAYVQVHLLNAPVYTAISQIQVTFIGEQCASEYTVAWPNNTIKQPSDQKGYNKVLVLGDGVAGSPFVWTPTTALRYRIKSIRFILVTAVAAANRSVQLNVYDGTGNNGLTCNPAVVQVASKTYQYNFFPGAAVVAGDTTNQATVEVSCPMPVVEGMGNSFRLEANAFNLQAADQFKSMVVTAEIWNEFD